MQIRHLLDRYQEKFYFNPGDTGFKIFRTKYAVIGVAICWDQWFPEAARAMVLQGAEVAHIALDAKQQPLYICIYLSIS